MGKSSKKNGHDYFTCEETCFANKCLGGAKTRYCTILTSQPCLDLSDCPFKKPKRDYTDGVHYKNEKKKGGKKNKEIAC